MDNNKVVVGHCRPGLVSGRFMDSLVGLLLHDARKHNRIIRGGGTIGLESGPRVAEARSQIVDEFMNSPILADAGWLLMVDADMTFDADLVDQLLRHADPKRVPILGGLCFAGGYSSRVYPTIYREFVDDDGRLSIEPVEDYPENALVKCGATGAACLLVHRSVYRRMAKPHPEGFGTLADGRPNPYPWFAEGLTDSRGVPLGEDIAFCRKARMLEIPVHVHTGIQLGHVKTAVLTEQAFLDYRDSQMVKELSLGAVG